MNRTRSGRPGSRPTRNPKPATARRLRERMKPKEMREKEREKQSEPQPFRVLIAVSRPRYRSRAERATLFDDWAVRILTNKEDPIGLINQLMPDLYIVSDDFGGSKKMGMLTAAQKWREKGLKVVALFEDEERLEEAEGLYDAALFPPWKTAHLREIAATLFQVKRDVPPTGGPAEKGDKETE